MRSLLLALCVVLSGCSVFTPNKTVEVSIDSMIALSGQIDMYEKRGWITNETEDELQNSLIDALNLLQSVYDVSDVAGCNEAMSRQECIQVILTEIELRLLEAENGN